MKITIYQMTDSNDEIHNLMFMDYKYISKRINIVSDFKKYYTKKYEYEDTFTTNKEEVILDEVFTKFNLNRPNDFKGHSLSVSDVVSLDDKLYFCDGFGWRLLY